MGRIRTIKPEFHAHEELSVLPAETHLLAAALLNYADDEGYFNAHPGLVKAGTHPLRNDGLRTEEQLAQLEAMGYIERFSCADSKIVGRIVNFGQHQRVSNPTKSKLRAVFELASGKTPESELSSSPAAPAEVFRRPTETPRPEQGTGNGEQGTGNRERGTGNRTLAPSAPPLRAGPAPPLLAVVSASPVFLELPMLSGKAHAITEADVGEYGQSYPAVDVRQELRKMREWLKARPAKLSKTQSGSKQRVARWLAEEQDRGGTRGRSEGHSTGGWRGAGSGGKAEAANHALERAQARARERHGG